MSPSTTDRPKPDEPPGPPRSDVPRWGRRVAASLALWVLLAALALGFVVAAGWWVLRTSAGSAWLLTHAPGIQVEAPRGPLLGDFSAAHMVVALPGRRGTLVLDRLAWRGVALGVGRAPQWGRLRIETFSADRVALTLAPGVPPTGPTSGPTDLNLPVEIEVSTLRIGELRATGLGADPIRDLSAHLHLGAGDGTEHRVENLALGWQRLLVRADARIATRAPLVLRAVLGVAQDDAGGDAAGSMPKLPPWRAAVALIGPLTAPELRVMLRADPGTRRPPQGLDVRATLHPFAAWPLGDMQASAQGLDLSAFAVTAPSTALDLNARASSVGADRPAQVTLAVTNRSPGPWNEGRLPLRELVLDLAGRPDQPDRLDLRRIDATLGNSRAAAGRVQGTGQWSPRAWRLDATLDRVQPDQLDARAPAMTLSGPVRTTGAGAIDLTTTLTGSVIDRGTRRPLRFTLGVGVQERRVELREWRATAGGAQAFASGLFTQAGAGAPWLAKAQARLDDFDPGVWLPKDAAAWHRAPTRLNLQASIDLNVPSRGATGSLLPMLAALRGQADLALAPSELAGVPAVGTAHWRTAGDGSATFALQLDAAGNRARADGRLHLGGNGSNDDWTLALDAPSLTRLAPAYRLLVPAESTATLAGALTAKAHASGRWPTLAVQGQLDAEGLQAGPLAVRAARASWALGSAPGAPVEAEVALTHASWAQGGAPGPGLEQLRLQLHGTARAHTVAVQAELSGRPPGWTDALQAGAPADPGSGTVAVLQARGGVVDLPGAALAGWRGTIAQIGVRGSRAGSAPWLQTQNLELDVGWGGGPAHVALQPGRVDLLGGSIRWSRLAWEAGAPGASARIEADAELEPVRVAPLLARAQPAFGWGGDLAIGGHVRVHSSPAVSADVTIERRSGDLSVTDELGTRAFGLTDLRLGLAADNGTWNFTQGLAGTAVGVLAGAEVIQTAPQLAWPGADAPLRGVLELRVAELGAWGAWVPPGWRLGGALHTNASFGGRFGAPEVTGRIDASKITLRNFLQGVNVTDGEIAVRLQGTSAHIERVVAHAGDGTVTVTGDAELGAAPRAVLQLEADKFQLLGRVDRRLVASGHAQLRIDSKSLALDGRLGVDEGLIDFTRSDAPALSDDVVVRRADDRPSPAAAAAAAARPPQSPALAPSAPNRAVAIDLQVNLGQDLKVRGHGLDAKLRGDLRVTSPGGALAVNGTVRAEEGTYAAYGQKLSIDRGLISFSGGVDNPRLDIEATRPDIDTRVGVVISGTPANLRVRLFSDPDMSEIDKLSWLVMGHASDSLGRGDTALLQRAALALLSGEGGGPTDQITKALGLDDISLSQQTNGDVSQTVLALGKQISKRWYVGYERGLNATTGSFQLIYRVAQRFTIRLQGGDDNSADVIWTWRWK